MCKKNFKSLGYNGAFDAAGVVPDDTGLGVLAMHQWTNVASLSDFSLMVQWFRYRS